MIRELAVIIENRPGRARIVAEALAAAGIDMLALCLADRESTGVLRFIASDVVAARRTLMKLDLPAEVANVLGTEIPDRPGGLAEALSVLDESGIDVRYLYAFRQPGTDRAIVVFHTDRDPDAEEVLTRAGFAHIAEDDLRG